MARKGLTVVAYAALLEVAQSLNLNVVKKGGWTKCFAPGHTKGAALGIPNTEKKGVTRVELVNFTHEDAVAHPKPSAGSVTGMIDFAQDEKLILNTFRKMGKAVIKAQEQLDAAAELKALEAEKAKAAKEAEKSAKAAEPKKEKQAATA